MKFADAKSSLVSMVIRKLFELEITFINVLSAQEFSDWMRIGTKKAPRSR
jgi:hypothetical protein